MLHSKDRRNENVEANENKWLARKEGREMNYTQEKIGVVMDYISPCSIAITKYLMLSNI
jgi:hypothetical protein